MLLVFPPIAKACEPPAGIARLAGVLRFHDFPCTLLDANIEAQLFLLDHPVVSTDTWSRRAVKNLSANLSALQSQAIYNNISRYQRAVADVNRILEINGKPFGLSLSLENYQDNALSPQKSKDLLAAAETHDRNIFYPYFSQRLSGLIFAQHPASIGFSLNYLSQAITTFAMIGFVRKHYPEITIILGGGLVTSWLRNPAWENHFAGLVDHLVAGPGEEQLLAILGKKGKSISCMPDYSDLPQGDYLAPGFILPYAASSGCYWSKCSFCPEKAEDNPYLPLAPDQVMADIQALVKQTGPILLHMLDNAISPKLLQAFIDQPPRVDWYGFARVSARLADLEFCRGLRKSGCVMLKLGLESGDGQVLEAMNKGIDPGLVSKALVALKEAGIATYVYLLFGTPQESIAQARNTLEFIVQHKEAVNFFNLAIFNMPVCGPDADDLELRDFYEGDLALYRDFVHPRGWNRKEVRKFLDQEFRRHPDIAAILRRDPPHFTSNHAPFFI
ncbi:MAG: radical SAM protein [Proteobacteria bacterium]|nr:radical SAM protein [Pseudomonadota bacterium]MBU1710179.1 radical SAM protein [Pseudomonadota bacterium]